MTLVPEAPRFNAAEMWHSLSPEQQEQIGTAALLLNTCCTRNSLGARDEFVEAPEECPPDVGAFMRGEEIAWDMLDQAMEDAVPQLMAEAPPLPDLAPYGVRVCHHCGCTDDMACEGGCAWVGPNLCSACSGGSRA